VSWSSKKQTSVALSTAEAEYVAAGQCYAQLLWMRQTLRYFGYNLSKVPLLCDNESAIRLADNPIEHSRTKHIDIRHHFLRDHQQKEDIDIYHISTGLSGVHRTVSGALTDPEDQRSDVPDMEGDRSPDSYSDCPVVHRTVRCTTRQKASLAFQVGLQRLLAALGL
jgi:hypothetical protein